ncbi:MAG: L,D-transpeptidase family protein [Clostridium sp.]
MKKLCYLLLFQVIIFMILPCNISSSASPTKYKILIDVNELTLSLLDSETTKCIKKYPISIGSLHSPSPIGTWQIKSKAIMKGPYGGYWLGLNAPWDTFGIHGTSRPSSIGKMASGGCIRMYNGHIKELFNLVSYDTIVVVTAGPSFRFSPYTRTIRPNFRGTDVFEVQRRLKDLGYFKGTVNGIYEYTLEIPVLRYKRDYNIKGGTEITPEFLDSIGLMRFE